MNSVQIMGNLGRDPVMRATKTGRAVASFSVAVSRMYTTPQGEQKEITDWINVVAWGNLAEAVGNQLKKGSRVFVEGRYTTRSYDTPDGQRRWISEVNANFVAIPIGAPSHQQSQGNAFGGNGGYDANGGYNTNGGYGANNGGFNNEASQFGQSQPQSQPKSSFGQFGQASKDEDIPF